MNILKVIHGYPPRYNAGSEVYSQMLCQGLVHKHQVHVFTREENPFLPDFMMHDENDGIDARIKLHVINLVSERYRYRYRHGECDRIFGKLLDQLQPEIVHIGHLNHLSTSIINEIHVRKIPVVMTLHDYWLMCPRGQFMQRLGKTAEDLWPVCDGQTNQKCAQHCYAGATSGANESSQKELAYWDQWIGNRMQHVREMTALVDHFIAPSRYLYERFVQDFDIPIKKITYLDYGFDLRRFAMPRQRITGEPFTFGYIGTHIPAKGIQDLIKAFNLVNGDCQLRIWGRETGNTSGLKAIIHTLPMRKQQKIFWDGEYKNDYIMDTVFNHVDCIVVPSIWVENSPLVIHEALQAHVPIITADVGGMAEYIHHEVNGLLFKHRDITSLAQQMQRCLTSKELLFNIAKRGYLETQSGNIIGMDEHLKHIEDLYHQVISERI